MNRSPRNTTNDDTIVKLMTGLLGGIEAQERQGQSEVVNSTALPSECDTAAFEALGFTFGEVHRDDPLFREATLPAGWSRQGTEHAMHSVIVDERGVERVGIFYKAAFYDRRADMSISNVGYGIATKYIYGDENGPFVLRPDLTDEERDSLRASAEGYVKNAQEHPSIYGDRLPRAQSILTALA